MSAVPWGVEPGAQLVWQRGRRRLDVVVVGPVIEPRPGWLRVLVRFEEDGRCWESFADLPELRAPDLRLW